MLLGPNNVGELRKVCVLDKQKQRQHFFFLEGWWFRGGPRGTVKRDGKPCLLQRVGCLDSENSPLYTGLQKHRCPSRSDLSSDVRPLRGSHSEYTGDTASKGTSVHGRQYSPFFTLILSEAWWVVIISCYRILSTRKFKPERHRNNTLQVMAPLSLPPPQTSGPGLCVPRAP